VIFHVVKMDFSIAADQEFSTFFCSWPTKLVRTGVGPFFLLMAH